MLDDLKYTIKKPNNRITYPDSDSIPRKLQLKNLQERAYKSLELAFSIKNNNYNVFLAGENSLDRTRFLNTFIESYKTSSPIPNDLIYIHNFENQEKPILLSVPAGLGIALKDGLSKIIQIIRKTYKEQLESTTYLQSKDKLQSIVHTKKNELLKELIQFANENSFIMQIDDRQEFSFFPQSHNKKMSQEEFDALDIEKVNTFNEISELIHRKIELYKREISKEEVLLSNAQMQLDKSLIETILTLSLDPFKDKFLSFYTKKAKISTEVAESEPNFNKLSSFLSHIRNDICENYDIFIPKNTSLSHSEFQHNQELEIIRHDINIFVDNSTLSNPPFIWEENPSIHKLFGCIEREPEMGSLTTDFSLIKAGSLHKALGGTLVLYATDIIQNPALWDSLMRVLHTKTMSIQEITEQNEVTKTKIIEPEEIEIDTKIILVGTEELYESLLINDDRFAKLFKVKAQLTDYISLNTKNIQAFISYIVKIIDDNKLLPCTNNGLDYLIHYSTLLAEDTNSLSLEFSYIEELLIEANTIALSKKLKSIDDNLLLDAYNSIVYRKNLVQEVYLEDIQRDYLKISTNGSEIGVINALSIISYANFEFGLPHQISCSVGVGHDGLVSLEREVDQSGSIHSKAILILKAFLNQHFAQQKALTFNASLYFEQSYTGIEGDSASLAELLCLLSALSNKALNLSIACTGAVNQQGKVLSVGGVNTKIEAFYKVCKNKKLTKNQAVIAPYSNKDNIILSKEIEEAIQKGLFTIYLVKDLQEAIQIYFNMPAGKIRKNGTYPDNTLYSLVDNRLKELGYNAQSTYKKKG